MNREIKFRAWDSKEEIMWTPELSIERYSSKYLNLATGVIIPGTSGDWGDNEIKIDIDIMQYTGMRDKNGSEIYEGDICTIFIKQLTIPISLPVEYWASGFCVWMRNKDGVANIYLDDIDVIQVIGNIHQDPELLR